MTQSRPNGEPQAHPEGGGPIVPIGTLIPHDQFVSDLPLGLWDLHTVESWAMAVLQEAMDVSSRPPQPPPGQDPEPVRLPQGNVQMSVQFTVRNLGDGSVGVAATFDRNAEGGTSFYSHHLVRLHVRASEPLTFEKPDANRISRPPGT
jgi:hypothetical protein